MTFLHFQSQADIDNYFFKCLSASNFDSLSKAKELFHVLSSAKINGSFDESTYFGYLFDETRRKVNLSADETEEIFSIEIIYHLENGAMERVRNVPVIQLKI